MCVPVNEQETVITFSRDSNEATIYTSDTTVMNKLDKLCSSSDDKLSLLEQNSHDI